MPLSPEAQFWENMIHKPDFVVPFADFYNLISNQEDVGVKYKEFRVTMTPENFKRVLPPCTMPLDITVETWHNLSGYMAKEEPIYKRNFHEDLPYYYNKEKDIYEFDFHENIKVLSGCHKVTLDMGTKEPLIFTSRLSERRSSNLLEQKKFLDKGHHILMNCHFFISM